MFIVWQQRNEKYNKCLCSFNLLTPEVWLNNIWAACKQN